MSEIHVARIELKSAAKKTYAVSITDQELLAILHEDTILKFSIGRGSRFSALQWQQILEYDTQETCLQQAYRFLSRRPHLEKELWRKLHQKNYTPETCSHVMARLREKGYLDDSAFIKAFVKDQMHIKKLGPLRIKAKLLEKGADLAGVEKELNRVYGERKRLENARAHLLKKARASTVISLKEKQKLVRYLQGKGFFWATIDTAFVEEKIGTRVD